MAIIDVSTEGSDPSENLSGWLEKRDAGPEPATPAPAQPTDWKEATIPEDVDHGFFKGKKVGVLYESYKHSENAKQAAERERNELRAENEKLRREREADDAARRVHTAQQPRQPDPDPDAEIEQILLQNPKEGIRAITERAHRDAERLIDERWQQREAEREQRQGIARVYEVGGKAYDEAFAELSKADPNLTRELFNDRAPALMHHFTNPTSRYYGDGDNLLRKEAYLDLWPKLYGTSQQVVVKAATEPPMPPGAKRPGSAAKPSEPTTPIDRDDRAARRMLAEVAGIDPDKFIARGEKRRG